MAIYFKNNQGTIIEVGASYLAPSTFTQNIFTGATVPLTYKDNNHAYENTYEYTSDTHNITITGLSGRATISENGTTAVTITFDVTGAISSLKNFTITCTKGSETIEYIGLHAHYGSVATGIVAFAYTNVPKDGDEGTIGVEYKFIETTTLPLFSSATTLWQTIYSYQLLNVLLGNHSGSITNKFLSYCYSFNQPLKLPANVPTIGTDFLSECYAFNQKLELNSNLTSINNTFLSSCRSFNQELILPSNISSIGSSFLSSCSSFNQELILPDSLTTIGTNFLDTCTTFNQPLDMNNLQTIGSGFLSGCSSFNSLLTISNLSTIPGNFLASCITFNQQLVIPSSVSSIGDYFLRNCYIFSRPWIIPSGVLSIGGYFLYNCYAFNQPLSIPNGVSSIGANFLYGCYCFNKPLTVPSTVTTMGTSFLYNCHALSTVIYDASVYPTDNYSLGGANSKANQTSGAGVKIYGAKRAELIAALPGRASSPYRKLINGGS